MVGGAMSAVRETEQKIKWAKGTVKVTGAHPANPLPINLHPQYCKLNRSRPTSH